MNCQVLRTLYVKSNGEVPCECDAGERVPLGWLDTNPGWSLDATLNGQPYLRMRASLALNTAPWDNVCASCSFLRPQEPMRDELGQRHIAKLQIEPSLYCNLRCPCCSRLRQIRERRAPHALQPELFERLMRPW